MKLEPEELDVLRESNVRSGIAKLMQQIVDQEGRAVLKMRSEDPTLVHAKARYDGAQKLVDQVRRLLEGL